MSDPSGRAPQLRSIGERIRWMIRDHLGSTHAEFAERLGVKRPQLSRWINRPEQPPSEAYLERIAGLGGVSVVWLRYGVGMPAEADGRSAAPARAEPAPGTDEIAAEDLFRHFEGLVRRMGGADIAPEELKLRKLDVVEGLKRLYSAQGTIPSWVYDLKGRILRDEL